MRCPECESPLAFSEKMQLWDEEYGEFVTLNPDFPAAINFFCESILCRGGSVVTVYIFGGRIELDYKTQAKPMKEAAKIDMEKN